MYLARKTPIILFLLFVLFGVIPTSFAQDGSLQSFENEIFSVEVPASLEVQAQGSDFVTFATDNQSIDIRLIRPTSDQAADALLATLQFAFVDTNYVVEACTGNESLPCVSFTDSNGTNVFRRALLHDAANNVFFAVTFQAASQADLDAINPDAILASFKLTTAAEVAIVPDDRPVLFNAVVTGNVNLRSCASTDCSIVGQAANSQVLPVLGEDGDWYEVQWENGTAFIASWLTTRGPDVHVDLTEGYVDPVTGCSLYLRKSRGDSNLSLAIYGDRQNDIWVDVYRVNENAPLEVSAQYDKTFIDTGDTYIHQTYYWGTWWPTGTYRIELELDGESSLIGFDFENGAEHLIYVECN